MGDLKPSKAWREAAETALRDPHFSRGERQRNHDYYLKEALRLEAEEEQTHGQQIATTQTA